MTKKAKLCSCGFPQSYPIPHEHDRTEREKQIIGHYENLLRGPKVTREELIRTSYAVIDEGIGPVIDEVIKLLRSRGLPVVEEEGPKISKQCRCCGLDLVIGKDKEGTWYRCTNCRASGYFEHDEAIKAKEEESP